MQLSRRRTKNHAIIFLSIENNLGRNMGNFIGDKAGNVYVQSFIGGRFTGQVLSGQRLAL